MELHALVQTNDIVRVATAVAECQNFRVVPAGIGQAVQVAAETAMASKDSQMLRLLVTSFPHLSDYSDPNCVAIAYRYAFSKDDRKVSGILRPLVLQMDPTQAYRYLGHRVADDLYGQRAAALGGRTHASLEARPS